MPGYRSDLVFWKRLPPALVPDVEYDYDGVFSGSAAFAPDGTPVLLYTGRSPLCPFSRSNSTLCSANIMQSATLVAQINRQDIEPHISPELKLNASPQLIQCSWF